MSAAVPTIWFMLLQHLEANPHITLPDLSRVAIGGSACPEALMRTFHDEYHVNVIHALDMTETSPLGAICKPKGSLSHLSEEDLWNQRVKQGRALFGERYPYLYELETALQLEPWQQEIGKEVPVVGELLQQRRGFGNAVKVVSIDGV